MSNIKPKRKLLITKDDNDNVVIVEKHIHMSPSELALTSIAESIRMIALVMTGNVAIDMEKVAESVDGKVGPLRSDSPSQTVTDGENTYVREQLAENTWLRYTIGKGGIRSNAQIVHPNGDITDVEF